ncbi:hypothetical protein AAY473_034449 [Plecturocebus cupreus]
MLKRKGDSRLDDKEQKQEKGPIHQCVLSDSVTESTCQWGDKVLLCRLGSSAVAQSRLTATCTSWVQAILVPLSLLSSWDYRKTAFCRVGQADLKLLTSSDPPAMASQSAWITGLVFSNGLTVLPRLECSCATMPYRSLGLPDSRDPPHLSL